LIVVHGQGQGATMRFTQKIYDRLNDNPLYNTIGIKIESAAEGKARSVLRPNPKLCWPFADQPHGGIVFTLMDTTMAWAVMSQLDSGLNCATVNLNINYTNPAKGDLFFCSAWTTHKTGRSCFVRADIRNCDQLLLAMGQATFRIIQFDLLS